MGPHRFATIDAAVVETRPTYTDAVMKTLMIITHQRREIFGPIVQAVTVYVMRVLADFQRSAEFLFQNDSMFKFPHVRFRNFYFAVSRMHDAPASHGSPFAALV